MGCIPGTVATDLADQADTSISRFAGGETLTQQGLTALRTGGRSLLANAGDATRRAYLGRNNATLADLFAAPDSVAQIRDIVMRRAETPYSATAQQR